MSMRQRIKEAAEADAFFSGLTLSSADVQELHREIVALEDVVKAVEADPWDGITLNDVNGKNWFDARDAALR